MDLIKFPWDNDNINRYNEDSKLTIEDIERLKNKAEQLKHNL